MNRGSLRLALGWIVLAASLLHGAEKVHDFTKWEKEISAFEQRDSTNPPPQNAILFIGSSTIRLWSTLSNDYPHHQVINRGFGGSEVVDSTHFADRIVFSYQPRMIFLRAGGNDLAAGRSAEEVAADLKDFCETVHAKLPHTMIAYIGWNPTIARWSQADKEKALNAMAKDYIKDKPWLKYIDTYDMVLGADNKPRPELFVQDKLHFSPAGYKLLVEKVRPFMPMPDK
jgi:lysophospholipase L1-like esterase